MSSRPFLSCVLAAAVVITACKKGPASEVHAAAPVLDAGTPRLAKLTFLLTGAENGYLLPTPDEGKLRGGAAHVLQRWISDEGHCAGALSSDGASSCPTPSTVVLSTGDNGNGQAISSYFRGEPTAELMRHMGYAASALGNRELDWPRQQFLANTAKGGFPYLAANLRPTNEEGRQLALAPWRLLTRGDLTVGVIGLAARKATVTPMPGRMAGVEHISDEAALAEAVAAVRKAGASVVAVVSDGCLHQVPPLLEAHPEWKLAFLAGRQCDEPFPETAGSTRLVYPGRHFNAYGRVAVVLDLARPVADRLVSVEAKTIDVVSDSEKSAAEPRAQELIAAWRTKLDAALGEQIGFTHDGVEQDSALMASWLTTAIRDQLKTDVALLNRRGVRQSLPPGPITKASVYDLVPFSNQLVVAKVNGDALLAAMANVEARTAGVRPKGDGFVDAKGQTIEPSKTYSVATLDYLYLGGDGFALHRADPSPTQTNLAWQNVLIEWTQAKKSDSKRPLEAILKSK